MTPTWLPVAGGIVPLAPFMGPLQEEERFASHQHALEEARAEYQARRYEQAHSILTELIPTMESLADDQKTPRRVHYALLLASALVLKARIHWRRAERFHALGSTESHDSEMAQQEENFDIALRLFRKYKDAIPEHPVESRLQTDFGIALHRKGQTEEAIGRLQHAMQTGAAPVEAFAYLGMAYTASGAYPAAVRVLRKGLQLAPGDKVLLETLARTQDAAGAVEEAVRTFCRAAVAAGKDEDLSSASDMLKRALELKDDDPQAISMLTLLLSSKGESDAALLLLDRTLEHYPAHTWALGLRGILRNQAGRTDDALQDFAAAKVEGAELAWIWIEHAKALAERDPKGADRLLQLAAGKLGEKDPRLTDARLTVALTRLAKTGRAQIDLLGAAARWLSQAEGQTLLDKLKTVPQLLRLVRSDPSTLLRWVTEQVPGSLPALVQLGQQMLLEGRLDEAQAMADKASAISEDQPDVLRLRGEIAQARGDIGEAVRQLTRAYRNAPHDEAAFAGLIKALVAAGRKEEALRELDRKLAEDPQHGAALTEKGRLLLESGRAEECLAPLETAEQLLGPGPTLLAARVTLGRVWRALNRYEPADAAFRRALANENELADAHAYLGLLLLDTAQYQEAAEILADALAHVSRVNPGAIARLSWLHTTWGWALYCAGTESDTAIETAFREGLRLCPKKPVVQKVLGQLLLRVPGREGEGRDILERLSELSVNEAPHDLIGWCHFRLGRMEAAERWLQAAAAADPSDAAIRFDLALVLLTNGSTAAGDEFGAALKLTQRQDVLRQRGLFHIAFMEALESTSSGVVRWSGGEQRIDELRTRLLGSGFPADRLGPMEARVARLRQSASAA